MKTKQEKIDLLNKLIVEAIHGKPFEEAVLGEQWKEGCQAFSDECGKKDEAGKFICQYCRRWFGQDRYIPYPSCLSRVMAALNTSSKNRRYFGFADGKIHKFTETSCEQDDMFQGGFEYLDNDEICSWKPLVNNRTAYVEDQDIETIESLINLLTNK